MIDATGLFQRGDKVRVLEEGIKPWVGRVTAAKPSSESGWWYEVRRDDGITLAVPEAFVESEEGSR